MCLRRNGFVNGGFGIQELLHFVFLPSNVDLIVHFMIVLEIFETGSAFWETYDMKNNSKLKKITA